VAANSSQDIFVYAERDIFHHHSICVTVLTSKTAMGIMRGVNRLTTAPFPAKLCFRRV
jgi:hypothetical protein